MDSTREFMLRHFSFEKVRISNGYLLKSFIAQSITKSTNFLMYIGLIGRRSNASQVTIAPNKPLRGRDAVAFRVNVFCLLFDIYLSKPLSWSRGEFIFPSFWLNANSSYNI
jgi:hypothetical protein